MASNVTQESRKTITILAEHLKCARMRLWLLRQGIKTAAIFVQSARCWFPNAPPLLHRFLDHQTLDLVLASPDLAHEVAGFVRGDGARDDRTADTACTAERHLALDVNVRDLKENIVSHTSLSSSQIQRTFLSSHRRGRCSRIASGVVSAARTMSSLIPRFRVLVDSLAPFFVWR